MTQPVDDWVVPGAPRQADDWISTPAAGVQPATRLDRFLTGAGDAIHGGAQFLVNALPDVGVDAVNDATRWVNQQPVIGPITRAIGMTPATREQVNQGVQQREADYQESRRQGGAGPEDTDWYRMGGQIASAVPLAVAAPAGATLLRAGASGAAQGAVMGAAQPVTGPGGSYWDEKGAQVGLGAVTGGVGGAAGHALGGLFRGSQNVAPNVRALHDAGVEMTPGQIAGGYARRVEDAVGSVPVMGAQVRSAQRNSIESFNRATANRVLAPLGQHVDASAPVGRDLIADVSQRVSQAYDDALSRVTAFGPDAQFAQDIAAVGQQFLTPQSQQTFARLLGDRVVSRLQRGAIDGNTFKTMDAELGQIARTYSGSAIAADREIAHAVSSTQRAMRDLAARTNPQAAPAIRAADEAYANLVRMEGAAASQGATEGVFSPAQLSRAVQRGDHSPRDRAFARGDARMQDLSDAARSVLPQTVPDSGTPERMMLAGLLGGNAGAAAMGVTNPLAAGVMAAGAGAYTNPIQRMYQAALLQQRPAWATAAGTAIAPTGAGISVPLAGMLLSPPERLDQRR